MKKFIVLLALTLMVSASFAGSVYKMKLTLDKPDGLYSKGDTAVCRALLLKNGKPAVGETLRCVIKEEAVEKKHIDVKCNGKAQSFKATMDRPGWVLFSFSIIGEDGKPLSGPTVFRHRRKDTVVGEIGVVFDRDKILPLVERPADFDEFWAKQRAELDKIPLDPIIKEVEPSPATKGKVKCYAIKVKCTPGENPVTGYMAVPVNAKPKSLPVVIDYLSRTWLDASKEIACKNAASGNVVALYISWHGFDTGHPAKWYKKQRRNYHALAGIGKLGKWSNHVLYMRVMRACDFAKTIPEWNGKDLIARGGSLGGILTIAAAALVPEVSLAIIGVPSNCEINGPKSGRGSAGMLRKNKSLLNKPEVMKAMSYYDAVNFAPRIKCETYVATGFTDELCYPSNVIAFYNSLPQGIKKNLTTVPTGGHYGLTHDKAAQQRVAKGLNSVRVFE